jgi:DNA-directed RNA polymerase subunit alpha
LLAGRAADNVSGNKGYAQHIMTVMEVPQTATIEVRERRDNYAKFVIEPLERGFGTTLGSALRRVLLSSIHGAAVTYVKIDTVLHEFSTIPGVVEDVTNLLLNLKGLPIKLNTEDPKVLTLSVSGSRDVTAADITPDADVEILQPDYHIATLTAKSARLSMEIGVEKGRGYVTADRQKNVEHMIGLIPMDSIFSPIRKVNFAVDDTRVGQSVDFDRLSVEVETNGSITPDDALAQAALILQEQLDIFTGFNAEEKTPTSAPTSEWDIPVETLNLSVRSFNCLKRAGISKVSELLDMSEDEIIKMRNFGKKSLDEIKQVLSERGLALRGA